MEVPVGLEPAIIELQSIALPTWLRNQRLYIVSHIYFVDNIRYNIFLSFPNIQHLIYSNNTHLYNLYPLKYIHLIVFV